MPLSEKARVDEIGDRFDNLHKPLAELAMRLTALNREFPNNPLYMRALADITPMPDKMPGYASLFWDAAIVIEGGSEAEKTRHDFERELKRLLPDLPDPLGLFKR